MIVKSMSSYAGSPVRTGNVQVQSSPLTAEDISKKASEGTPGLNVSDPSQATSTKTTFFFKASDGLFQPVSGVSNEDLFAAAKLGMQLVPASSTSNVVMPSFRTSPPFQAISPVDLSSTIQPITVPFLEQLSGLANWRPEFISLVHFVPLYTDTGAPTPAMQYLRYRDFLSKLNVLDAVSSIKTFVGSTFFSNASAVFASSAGAASQPKTTGIATSTLASAVTSFFPGGSTKAMSFPSATSNLDSLSSAVSSLKEQTDFLVTAHTYAQSLKVRLDLRNTSIPLEQSKTDGSGGKTFSIMTPQMMGQQVTVTDELSRILQSRSSALPEKYTIIDFFTLCGYTADNVMKWTSSRLWTQLCHEVARQLTESGSNTGLIQGSAATQRAQNKTDANQTKTEQSGYLVPFIVAPLRSAPLMKYYLSKDLLDKMQIDPEWESFLSATVSSYKAMAVYSQFSTPPSKPVVIVDSFTKEYRYSKMAGSSSAVTTANKIFGVSIVTGGTYASNNSKVFSAIFDTPTPDVFKRPAQADKSFAGLARTEVTVDSSQALVSLFEPVQLDNVGGTYTIIPGGTYYVDSLFELKSDNVNFNVKNLYDMMVNMSKYSDALVTLIDEGNFLAKPMTSAFNLDDPTELINKMVDEFILPDGSANPKYSLASAIDAEKSLIDGGLAGGIDGVIPQTGWFNVDTSDQQNASCGGAHVGGSQNSNPFQGVNLNFGPPPSSGQVGGTSGTGEDPEALKEATENYVSNRAAVSKIVSLRMMALLAYANKDVDVKAALFTLVASLVSLGSAPLTQGERNSYLRSVGNVCANVSTKIIQKIAATAPSTSVGSINARFSIFGVENLLRTLVAASMDDSYFRVIIDAMTESMKLMRSVSHNVNTSGFFSEINQQATDLNYTTNFSGLTDVAALAALFDAFCSVSDMLTEVVVTAVATMNSVSGSGVLGDGNYIVLGPSNKDRKTNAAAIKSAAEKELAALRAAVITMTGYMNDIVTRSKGLLSHVTKADSVNTVKMIVERLGDKRFLPAVVSESQVRLLYRSVRDLTDRIAYVKDSSKKNTSDVDKIEDVILDDAVLSENQTTMLRAAFSTSPYRPMAAHNKKIVSVGIPIGMVSSLKQRIDASKISSSKIDMSIKQMDIVRLNVYKVDVENTDIVFEPVTHLFEMSRFVSRVDSSYRTLPMNPTFQDIVKSVPTLDLGDSSWISKAYSYGYDAMSSSGYKFLSDEQKHEIIDNHIMSHLLELYIRIMTGVDVDERKFHLIEPPSLISTTLLESFIDMKVSDATKVTATSKTAVNAMSTPLSDCLFVLASSTTQNNARSPYAGSMSGVSLVGSTSSPKTSSARVDVNSLTPAQTQRIEKEISNTGILKGITTVYSDPDAVVRTLIVPKKFDRVFNVIIDPDDFYIDQAKTRSSAAGRRALDRLVAAGTATDSDPKPLSGRSLVGDFMALSPAGSNLKMRTKQRNEGDYSFEKYFVTVETVIDGAK